MKFALQITCDNAAFAPVHDDASEPERYEAAAAEVLSMLASFARKTDAAGLEARRAGNLFDLNGNRCGQWSLSDFDDEPERETLDAMLARHARELREAFPERIPAAPISASQAPADLAAQLEAAGVKPFQRDELIRKAERFDALRGAVSRYHCEGGDANKLAVIEAAAALLGITEN